MDFTLIPVLVLFIITLICNVTSGTYKAYYIKKEIKRQSDFFLLNAGLSGFCALTLFALNGFKFELSVYSLVLGLLFGFITMAFAVLNSITIKIGPYGYTSVIVNLSTAITAISGALFWHEAIGFFKVIGIVLMCVCFYFAIGDKNEKGKKANDKWLIMSLICLLLNSAVGLMQKIHQSSEYKSELMAFLIVAFTVSVIVSIAVFLFLRKKENTDGVQVNGAKEKSGLMRFFSVLSVMLVTGVGTAGCNAINLYLSGVIDSAVFFPIVNGVPLMMSLVVSFLLFKEKLKNKQLIGLFIGIVAVVCLFI